MGRRTGDSLAPLILLDFIPAKMIPLEGASHAPLRGTIGAMQITTRPLLLSELKEAERICNLAFGTFLGHPDPERFMAGHDYIRSRWNSSPGSAFAAEAEGRLVGSNLATNWGSFSFFGPLTVDPKFWNQKIGSALMHPVLGCFEHWECRLQGLFTFAQSSKHVGLYEKFGFWPRFITKIVERPVSEGASQPGLLFSTLSQALQKEALTACREVTDSVFEGLDLSGEIRSLDEQGLGEVVLIQDNRSISGFAICHCGSGTEAGADRCYIKFAAVRPGLTPDTILLRLLSAVEHLAQSKALMQIAAGVNTGRERIARLMAELGFKTLTQGLAMHRPNDAGFSRRDAFVLDDWR